MDGHNVKHNILKQKLLLLIPILLLSSCSDTHKAKELNGLWQTEYVMSYSNGEKDSITEVVRYEYDENSMDDDGAFKEVRVCQTNDIVEDGIHYSVHYTSSITGRYEVLVGDLYLKYNLSSLEVDLDKVSGGTKIDYSYGLFGNTYSSYRQIDKDELKKNIYETLWKLYRKNSKDDTAFRNLRVSDNKMNCENEEGTTTYTKLSD